MIGLSVIVKSENGTHTAIISDMLGIPILETIVCATPQGAYVAGGYLRASYRNLCG